MKYAVLTILAGILIGAMSSVASASRGYDHESHPGYICSDNGTSIFVQDVRAALRNFPKAKEGKCVEPVTPPVVPVPEVIPPLPGLPSVMFLCYSHFGTETTPASFDWDYGLWLWHNQSLTGKWFLPVAVPGNVDPSRGDNIGAYHLVCNPASTRTATGQGLGGSGEIYNAATRAKYDAEYTARLGADFQVWAIQS